MAHRPYPNPARARRQLDRHKPQPPTVSQPTAAEAGARLADFFNAMPRVGEYRISTR
ncbi:MULTISPECIES: hypothetical protein [Streptomyces]|uniref:hypothetical protein n=1 Tax=Streptomyces TaxID=1883 RepID=UPI0016786A60|nr:MULTISPECIES: hypothetical protein [Streptomyces]MBK3524842.1 hypothetical protein [Streptomyces sp. MBT70]GGR70986.1 hypothetical protein GCM10010236_26570 [Streptomyces eurythermus]